MRKLSFNVWIKRVRRALKRNHGHATGISEALYREYYYDGDAYVAPAKAARASVGELL